MSTPTEDLSAAGVSIWLDDLSRSRIDSGNLAELISTRNVTGVTTNPSIFQAAIGNQNDDSYDAPLAALASAGADVDTAIFEITTTDVRDAADIFRPVYDATGALRLGPQRRGNVVAPLLGIVLGLARAHFGYHLIAGRR